jgi:hypothetical protein
MRISSATPPPAPRQTPPKAVSSAVTSAAKQVTPQAVSPAVTSAANQVTPQAVSASVLRRATGDGDGRTGAAALNDGDAAALAAAQQVKSAGRLDVKA